MRDPNQRAVAALWSVRGVGPKFIDELERVHGPLGALLTVPIAEWLGSVQRHAPAKEGLRGFARLEDAASALEAKLASCKYNVHFPGDDAYPPALEAIADPPRVLFAWGEVASRGPAPRVAMVGTRQPMPDFAKWFRELAEAIAAAGVTVVSGAAEGCDTAAHLGALDAGGQTWAVLGCAIEQVDPHQRQVLRRIAEQGGSVLSELPPGGRPEPATFVRRNRIISGCADVTVVGRAPKGSGALHTARRAQAQHRPLLACPGAPWDDHAEGCHALLADGAKPCSRPKDVFSALGLVVDERQPQRKWAPSEPPSDPVQRAVLDALDLHPREFDVVAAAVAASSGQVQSALLELELQGYVSVARGRRYARLPAPPGAEEPNEVSDLLC